MKTNLKIDFWLLAPVLVLLSIGLSTLASINMVYFRNQIFSLVVACIIFLSLIQIDYNIFKSLKIPLYFSSLALLFVVFLIGIETRGAARWIELFGIRIQFSEICKPLLSLALASQISSDKNPKFKTFILTSILLAPVILFIYLQPDLGNALIFSGVFFVALIILGFPMKWFFTVFLLPFLLISPLLWGALHEYQRQRILTFIHPHKDPLGTSYNTIQALIAVGSGMLFGKGLGENTQSLLKFLPERHTDFIFATISEGMGFIGGLVVILTFAYLMYRVYSIFKNSGNLFEKTVLTCCFLFFFVQFFLNIGMNIGLLPIAGVTLPFVSYGGSSLVANFIFLAIVSSISTSQERQALEIR